MLVNIYHINHPVFQKQAASFGKTWYCIKTAFRNIDLQKVSIGSGQSKYAGKLENFVWLVRVANGKCQDWQPIECA